MAGMDPKILAAVFASIAAIAVGTGGTSVDNFQNANPQKIVGQFMDSPSGILGQFTKKPEPDNSVKIKIEVNSEEARLNLRGSELLIRNFNRLESSSRTISSDDAIRFLGFNGDVVIEDGNDTLVSGASKGFRTSGVNYSERMDLKFMTDSSRLRVDDTEKTAFRLANVDVKMVSRTDDTVIQKGNSSLNINSFTGDVTIYPGNMSFVLDGKVAKFEAGSTVFTG